MRTTSTALLVLLTSLLTSTAAGQGSKQDYEQAFDQRASRRGTVRGDELIHGWSSDGTRLWFIANLEGGGTQYRVCELATGRITHAFNHAVLAESLRAAHLEIDPDRLPLRRLEFDGDGRLRLLLQSAPPQELVVEDGKVFSLGDIDPAGPFAVPLRPVGHFGRGRRRGRGRVDLIVHNASEHTIRLDWLSDRGARRYDEIAPGERHVQDTHVGHLWRIVSVSDDATWGDVLAPELISLVRVEGPAAPTDRADEEEPVLPAPTPRVMFREHNAWLERPGESEVQLTTEGAEEQPLAGPVHISPDGRYLVVHQEHRAETREIHMVESSPDDQLQPKLHTLDYPKPGDPLDVKRPRMFDAQSGKELGLDRDLFPNPWNIRHGHWAADSSSFFFVHNERGHGFLRLLAVDVATGTTRVVIDEDPETFVDYNQKLFLHHLEDTNEVLWTSERSGWNHLYRVDRSTGEAVAVTSGEWVVRAVVEVDEGQRTARLRVMGIHAGQDPYHVHHAVVDFDTGELTVWTESDGTHEIRLSSDGQHLVATWSRADQPPVHEVRRTSDGALVTELARADASANLEARGGRFSQPFAAKGRDGTTEIWGLIHRPRDFDPGQRYPVIEAIYAGPHDHHVPKAFAETYRAEAMTELGFLVVQIDGMGTNWRSKSFHDVAHKNLADAGFPDRIAWLRAAGEADASFDLERVGIYGGSAGGQNAMRAVLDHHEFYRAAAADCGCHDNRMDKVWWNELWMGWPVDDSYLRSSNVEDADRLGGALFLTVGELDRNVDPASTMQVVDALIRADKDFELIVFPGGGHGSGGGRYGTRRMYDFFVRELHGVEPRWEGEPVQTVLRQRNQ
ncbi:MAG: peptidase S9 [Planctomycetes bacterium]|jgi:dienelactone hydrolase|nr:peptidase S9 [Planctomycetota bacterium]HJM58749.1 prolyl oligopeptidase family serine peptidase [Planctomycetota bacterium]